MPITKNGSDVIVESAPADLAVFLRTGVIEDADFAIASSKDQLKQLKFDLSALPTNTSVTLESPAASGTLLALTDGADSASAVAPSYLPAGSNLIINRAATDVNAIILRTEGSEETVELTMSTWGGAVPAGFFGTVSNQPLSLYANDTNGLVIETNGVASALVGSKLPSYAISGLPSAATLGAGTMVFVTDETGGAVPAFSDGTDWRRVTDRAVVS